MPTLPLIVRKAVPAGVGGGGAGGTVEDGAVGGTTAVCNVYRTAAYSHLASFFMHISFPFHLHTHRHIPAASQELPAAVTLHSSLLAQVSLPHAQG